MMKPTLPNENQPIVVAHRGGAGEGDQYAVDTYQKFVISGGSYIELDVRATAEGTLYVYHGVGLERTLRWLPLRQARAKQSIRFIDVLKQFPDIYFFVDPKHWPAVKPLAKVIVDAQASDRVFVNAFSSRRSRAVQRQVMASGGGTVQLGMSVVYGILLYLRGVFGIRKIWNTPFSYVLSPHQLVTAKTLTTAHNSNIKIIPWTINDSTHMQKLLELGVDGICTDYPSRLQAVIMAQKTSTSV